MSRLSLARALNGSGVLVGVYGTAAGLIGLLGVISTTPTLCPESVSAARCRAAGSKAALISAYGLIAAGAAGALVAAGRLTDPEA